MSEVELPAIPGAVVRSWDELVAEGRLAIDGFQWKLGDLACEVETTYGESSLMRYAAEIVVEYSTLRSYKAVAQAFPAESVLRSTNSWSIYRVLVAQKDRLELAARDQPWTVAEARELVAGRSAIQQPPTPGGDSGPHSFFSPSPAPPTTSWPPYTPPPQQGPADFWNADDADDADSPGAWPPLRPPLRDELPPAQPPGAHVGHNSGDNEWYTPAEYVKAAKAVMGDVDLDPASSDVANSVVGAYRFYTEADNGLSKPWSGRVWMNPPYAQPLVSQFAERLLESFTAGDVTEACVLVNNATETAWCSGLIAPASAICLPRGRIKFWHPRKESAPLQGQLIIYLGPRPAEFRAEFRQFGPVKGEF